VTSFEDIETENDRRRRRDRIRATLHFAALSALALVVVPTGSEPAPSLVFEGPEPRRRDGPPNRSREEARRRRQMASRRAKP
jgi:hypothetical protein